MALGLAGCRDTVTTRFATLEDAKARHAFDRGWLPPVLPNSATNIVERNNLDLNTGTGSFEYVLSERASYIERLKQLGTSLKVEKDSEIATLVTEGSRWEILLPRYKGQGYWNTRVQR